MNALVPSNGEKQQMSLWKSVQLAWNLGFIIAIPAVVLGFGGAYLDKALGTSPVFLLIGFILAAVLSGLGVVRRLRDIGQDTAVNRSPNASHGN